MPKLTPEHRQECSKTDFKQQTLWLNNNSKISGDLTQSWLLLYGFKGSCSKGAMAELAGYSTQVCSRLNFGAAEDGNGDRAQLPLVFHIFEPFVSSTMYN